MKAPQLIVQEWLNATDGYQLHVESSRIKLIHAFQMLCPACVYHGIPQTIELFEKLKDLPVDVVALHTVFEHHQVMTTEALKVFIKEWRLPFPVGVDQPIKNERLPATMKSYQMQGTPTTIVIDQHGELLIQQFGLLDTENIYNFVLELTKQIKKPKPA